MERRCLPFHNKSGDLIVQITLQPPRVVTYKIPLWMPEIASHGSLSFHYETSPRLLFVTSCFIEFFSGPICWMHGKV